MRLIAPYFPTKSLCAQMYNCLEGNKKVHLIILFGGSCALFSAIIIQFEPKVGIYITGVSSKITLHCGIGSFKQSARPRIPNGLFLVGNVFYVIIVQVSECNVREIMVRTGRICPDC